MGEDLGYYFHPAATADGIHHPRLDVNVYRVPTERHFDPDHAQFPVAALGGGIEVLTVTHPWPGLGRYRACAGNIILRDRFDRRVEAYSFGGDLTIVNQADLTACSLESPAPILQLLEPHGLDAESAVTVLVAEAEALLAQRRAHWAGELGAFDARLAAAPPLTLYAALLTAIDDHLRRIPRAARTERNQVLARVLRQAMGEMRAEGTWPEPVPGLAEVV